MESKSMELKVMHCNDLQAFNFFQKLLVYVLVSLVSEDPDKKLKQNQQQRTPTDTEDDGNPEWNHEMKFDLSEVSFVDCDHVFVLFDLRHEGLYFGDKTIGEVRLPLKDLIQESSGINRFVNYQVRSPEGKPNGILNFSYKVNAQGKDMGIHFPTSEITGYSVVHHHHHHESSKIQYPASEAESSLPAVHYPPLESGDNSGYSVVAHHHHESSEIRYPTSEAESSSPAVHYPPLESGYYSQETYPAAEASYPTQGTYQERPYPPTPYAYYPPSQPPPSPFLHRPPPSPSPPLPPPFLHGPPPPHGACYQHHDPPELRPWVRLEAYDYYGNWSRTNGHSHSFGHGETRRHDYGAYWHGR